MGTLDGQNRTVHNRVVALLVETQGRDLVQEVIVPPARSRVRVRADDGHLGLGVLRVLAAELGQALEDTVARRAVAAHGVDDDIDDAVRGRGGADDERAGVQALAETGADLVALGVPVEAGVNGGLAWWCALTESQQRGQ